MLRLVRSSTLDAAVESVDSLIEAYGSECTDNGRDFPDVYSRFAADDVWHLCEEAKVLTAIAVGILLGVIVGGGLLWII